MMKFLLLAFIPEFVKGSASWDYDRSVMTATGPDAWSTIDATCGGSNQSPIDIDTESATSDSSLGGFTMDEYSTTTGLTLTFTNNGHSAQLGISGVTMSLSGGDLGDTYELEQLHFHWGSENTNGSEHTIDDESYPMEMHLVHYKNDYSSVSDAAASNESDALAVLGFLFEISDSDNTNLDSLLNKLADIVNDTDTAAVTGLAIADLFGDVVSGPYWRYSGSLTTPGCNEIVTWTVFEETISISSSQLTNFRTLLDGDLENIVDNWRPVQSLGDRTVYYYDPEAAESKSSVSLASLAIISVVSLAARFI